MLPKSIMSAHSQKKNDQHIEVTPSASSLAIVGILFFAGLICLFAGGLKALAGLGIILIVVTCLQSMVKLKVSPSGLVYEPYFKKLPFRSALRDVALPQADTQILIREYRDKFVFFSQNGSMIWPMFGKEIILSAHGEEHSLGMYESSDAELFAKQFSEITGVALAQQ